MGRSKVKPTRHKTIELSQDAYILVTVDREIHEAQVDGPSLRYKIDDFYQQSIRNRLKHTKLTKKEAELLEQLKTELFDLVGDYI